MHRFILGLSCVLVAARGIAADEQCGAQRTTIDIGKGHAEIPEYFQEPRLVEFLREGGFAEGSKNAGAIGNGHFMAVEHVRKLVYHSPQKPGFTSWVGAWIMPDGDLMVSFTQATGPIKGRPEASKEIRERLNWPPKGAPNYDMTGLDLKNVHLRSNDAGKTWTRVSADPFRAVHVCIAYAQRSWNQPRTSC